MPAAVIFKGALPVLVSVTFFVALLPTATLLKASAEGLIDTCACGAGTVPLRLILSGDPGALETMETAPVGLPADVGVSVAVNEAVWPGFRLCGGRLVIVKPAPAIVAPVMDTGAVPGFDNVTEAEPLLPTETLPKFTLAGFAAKDPWVPVPAKATDTVESETLPAIVTLPEAAPAAVGVKVALKDALAPAAIVCPTATPVTPNPVPAELTCVMVTAALPVFFSETVWVPVLPTTILLKLTVPGLALSVLLGFTALPLIVNVCGDPVALSVNPMLPPDALVVVGVNCTLKLVPWPAFSVIGRERPVVANPAPVSFAAVSVRLAFPLFVSVTLCVLVWPTTILLKLRDTGEIDSAACVAMPATETVSGAFGALLITLRLPDAAPTVWGANWICTVTAWPMATIPDEFPDITVNPGPETVAWEISTLAVPVFVTVTLCVALLPTATFPKLRLLKLGDKIPVPGVFVFAPGAPVPALVTPAQLERPTIEIMTAAIARKPRISRLVWKNALRLGVQPFDASGSCLKFRACLFITRTV
jgi:hypothetical protein